MAKAKQGDQDAFGVLYEQFLTPVYRYVFVRLGDVVTAEDITQTVFLKVYENLQCWQPRANSPLAFFFTVARNTLIDYWKKKKDLPLNDALEIPDRTTPLPGKIDLKLAYKQITGLLKFI